MFIKILTVLFNGLFPKMGTVQAKDKTLVLSIRGHNRKRALLAVIAWVVTMCVCVAVINHFLGTDGLVQQGLVILGGPVLLWAFFEEAAKKMALPPYVARRLDPAMYETLRAANTTRSTYQLCKSFTNWYLNSKEKVGMGTTRDGAQNNRAASLMNWFSDQRSETKATLVLTSVIALAAVVIAINAVFSKYTLPVIGFLLLGIVFFISRRATSAETSEKSSTKGAHSMKKVNVKPVVLAVLAVILMLALLGGLIYKTNTGASLLASVLPNSNTLLAAFSDTGSSESDGVAAMSAITEQPEPIVVSPIDPADVAITTIELSSPEKSGAKVKDDITQDLGLLVNSANSIVNTYANAVKTIKTNDLVTWSQLSAGNELSPGILEACDQNVKYLSDMYVTPDGQVVDSLYERLHQLQEDGNLKKDDAYALETAGVFLQRIFTLHEDLILDLVAVETAVYEAGNDWTKIDQTQLAAVFAEVKAIQDEIDKVALTFNDKKPAGLNNLLTLDGIEGLGNKRFGDFLEAKIHPTKENVYVTATPNPETAVQDFAATLMPPTSTPKPSPTVNPCNAAITSDEGREFGEEEGNLLNVIWGVLLNEGYVTVEGWFVQCGIGGYDDGTWIVASSNRWYKVGEIGLTTGPNDHRAYPHTSESFVIDMTRNSDSLLPNSMVLTRRDTGQILYSDWPKPAPTLTAIAQRCVVPPPGYTKDQKSAVNNWRELYGYVPFPDMDSTVLFAWYMPCGDGGEYMFIVTQRGAGSVWFVQDGAPSKVIDPNVVFWVNESGDPFKVTVP